jgi:hypothetical protein
MKIYEGLKNIGKNSLDVLRFIGKYPLESLVVGSALVGVGCSERKSDVIALYYGKINDSLEVRYYRRNELDLRGHYTMYVWPDYGRGGIPSFFITMNDTNGDEKMDNFRIQTPIYFEGRGMTEMIDANQETIKALGLSREKCQEIYNKVRGKEGVREKIMTR